MEFIREKISGLMDNGIFVTCFALIMCIIVCMIAGMFKKDNFFYESSEISKYLGNIHKIKNEVYNEVVNVYSNHTNWVDWPEKELYANNNSWEIYPFFAFNIWVKQNCDKCPIIYDYLKTIKGLKLATLSKMTPGMKLKAHRGWANHSNHVIRCHYGLIVPEGCYISVSDSSPPPLFTSKKYKFSKCPENIKYKDKENNSVEEIRFHQQFKWIAFDDSKTHYAENMSTKDRIVLIVDIERPVDIKTGTSEVGDSSELQNIINYYKQNNVNYDTNIGLKLDDAIGNPYGIDKKKIDKMLYGT